MLKTQGSTISVQDDGVIIKTANDSSITTVGRAGIGMGAVISPAHESYDCSSQKLDDFQVNVTN